MTAALVYSPQFDYSMLGLERLHPFDSRKFSRAFDLVRRSLGERVERYWLEPSAPASTDDLLCVHTRSYLDSLRSSSVVAKAVELWPVGLLPNFVLERGLLTPMRFAVAGTLLAVRRVLDGRNAVAMNLAGGFHHAFRDHGEGFCLYADVAVALSMERARGALTRDDRVVIIDLDAHRGNGVWAICGQDPGVAVLDVYNFQIYPGMLPGDPDQYPFQIPLRAGTADREYLEVLNDALPRFLDSVSNPRLAIYNAGTDIVVGDPLGRLAVSTAGVATRDRTVIDALAQRGIPTAVVTSGGYSEASHELIAELALHVVARCDPGGAVPRQGSAAGQRA